MKHIARRKFAVLALVLGSVGFLGVGSCKPKTEELTIFHTNDIHSHLKAERIDPFGLGGLAKVSTLLQRLRKSAPLSMTLDAGDWSEGTWYFSVDAGANMLRMLDAMGYDGAVVGNHDFLDGPDVLMQDVFMAQPNFPVLAANLETSHYPEADVFRQAVVPSAIRQVGDLKVGLIGLTTFEALYDKYFAPVQIINTIDTATAIAKELRPQVDVLIIVSHNSFDANVQIASLVPGVDAVISGHSHRKVAKAVFAQNAGRSVPVVETGAYGKFLGELKLTVDKQRKMVTFKSYQLHPVTPDIPDDPTVAQMIQQNDDDLTKRYGDITKTVAHADFDLIQKDSQETPLGNLAVKAYRAATGADIAMEEISLTGVSIAKGGVSLLEAHDVVPHIYDPGTGKEWTVNVWDASGKDLATAINVFYTIGGLMPLGNPIGWLSIDNAQITWDPSRAKGVFPVKTIVLNGQPLDPGAHYKVALSSGLLFAFRLANEKFSLGVDLSQIKDTGIECSQAITDYIETLGELKLDDLRVGKYVHATGSDDAIFEYGVGFDGKTLSVEVENQGLSVSNAATLTCSSGLPNDLVDFDTAQQVWTPIAQVMVPALDPGKSTTIQIPWDPSATAKGYWPVQCSLAAPGDSYAVNNQVERVFHVQ